uniref:Carboxypeptidase n=1 Tax=Arion vulgaris TaxID=1028688 RepID=A0A0B6Y7W4_9EUPU
MEWATVTKSHLAILIVFICLCFVSSYGRSHYKNGRTEFRKDQRTVFHMSATPDEPNQQWGYIPIRPKANIFFWLYYTTHPSGYIERPIILWLQGGPGGSGTGFGNFEELGPDDVQLKPRNTTWTQTASVMFIDSPVGTGYSYVEDDSAYTTNVAEISADLLATMKVFIDSNKEFEKTPFYIFSESYGGKMAADFSAVLHEAISKGEIKINFQGFAMGDSWISPVDSTNSWGPYLYATSLVDAYGLNNINKAAKTIEELVKQGKYTEATDAWGAAEGVVEDETGGVNFYNILDWSGSQDKIKHGLVDNRSYLDKLYDRHVRPMANDDLDALMNGPIRKKLIIIPKNVTWGGQANNVFDKQAGDFMKNVTSTVNNLIKNTSLKVIVYSGQLDLICDVLGTETWFNRLDIAEKFNNTKRQYYTCAAHLDMCYYAKTVDNVQFYWILDAGHMVPTDNGSGALAMVNRIIG